MYLIDTNIISETIKKVPNKNVIKWLDKIDMHHIYLSVITLGEIRKGIEKINHESKKQALIQWLELDIIKQFGNRIIPVDFAVADKWGYLCSKSNLPAVDALIGATALVSNLKLVTRNTKDFEKIPSLEIINPWILE